VRSSVFHQLGGFDPYFFAHQEEIDLCWRMQRAGYQILCCPQSVVYHVGGGTLPRGHSRKTFLNFRNNQIMLWKNLSPAEKWWKIPVRLMLDWASGFKGLLSGDGGYFVSILKGHFGFVKWLMDGENAWQAVLNNVVGTRVVAEAATANGVEKFVLISTDKAVNPTNVMGATKRVAERAVRALAAGGRARTAVVRFGNVLGSAGSAVPLFERQIAHGGPVTITDPQMVRWFMTVQEAAALVLEAGALPEATDAGAVFVLDMGDPVRIDDLARQLIRLHGLSPDRDIPIRYTGLRPGEKLSEEIFYAAESVRPTAADGVLAAVDPAQDWAALEPEVRVLIAAAERRDEAAVLAALQRLEPAFRPG
jgi:hypothetical protein